MADVLMKKEKNKNIKKKSKSERKSDLGKNKEQEKKQEPCHEILSFPLPIRQKGKEKIIETLVLAQKFTNEYLVHGYDEDVIYSLSESRKKAYKVLEPILSGKLLQKIPSRINRGILEVTGRTLRMITARKNLFDTLFEMDNNPDKWDYRKLIEEKEIYVKSQWVKNLQEQTNNFIEKECCLPRDFFDL